MENSYKNGLGIKYYQGIVLNYSGNIKKNGCNNFQSNYEASMHELPILWCWSQLSPVVQEAWEESNHMSTLVKILESSI